MTFKIQTMVLFIYAIFIKSFTANAIGCLGEWPNQICPVVSLFENENLTPDHDHSEHGFVLLGNKQLHLYHLAKFRSPHRYQALVEIRITDSSGFMIDLDKIRRQVSGKKILSLLSRNLSTLPELLRTGNSFPADLYSGYLRDRDGRSLIAENIRVAVVHVPFFEEIREAVNDSKSHYDFVTVCDKPSGEIYGVHRVKGLNNFEQIFKIGTVYIPGGYPETNDHSIDIDCPGQGTRLEASPGFKDWPLPLNNNYSFSGQYEFSDPGNPHVSLIFGMVNEIVLDLRAVNP